VRKERKDEGKATLAAGGEDEGLAAGGEGRVSAGTNEWEMVDLVGGARADSRDLVVPDLVLNSGREGQRAATTRRRERSVVNPVMREGFRRRDRRKG